jgi:SAM-dependent methyltransferase
VTEQRLVFGEIAAQYEEARPSYPAELFDAVMEFGSLSSGDHALEIGAGTGKATLDFVARGLHVHALEPSGPMAAVLRAKGIDADEVTFEDWLVQPSAFQLVYAGQSWHWVRGEDRYDKLAAALAPGGVVALFWNQGRKFGGTLQRENDAVYERYAPEMTDSIGRRGLDNWVPVEIDACNALEPAVMRRFTWNRQYTTDEWIRLQETASDHRMLPATQREQLHGAVREVLDRHGGRVDVVYDTFCYLSRRA